MVQITAAVVLLVRVVVLLYNNVASNINNRPFKGGGDNGNINDTKSSRMSLVLVREG